MKTGARSLSGILPAQVADECHDSNSRDHESQAHQRGGDHQGIEDHRHEHQANAPIATSKKSAGERSMPPARANFRTLDWRTAGISPTSFQLWTVDGGRLKSAAAL